MSSFMFLRTLRFFMLSALYFKSLFSVRWVDFLTVALSYANASASTSSETPPRMITFVVSTLYEEELINPLFLLINYGLKVTSFISSLSFWSLIIFICFSLSSYFLIPFEYIKWPMLESNIYLLSFMTSNCVWESAGPLILRFCVYSKWFMTLSGLILFSRSPKLIGPSICPSFLGSEVSALRNYSLLA